MILLKMKSVSFFEWIGGVGYFSVSGNQMKPLYYIIVIDLLVIVVAARFIFGGYSVFVKSLADHFFPDDVFPNPLEKFAETLDSRHKINLLYAVVLFLAGITWLIDSLLLR